MELSFFGKVYQRYMKVTIDKRQMNFFNRAGFDPGSFLSNLRYEHNKFVKDSVAATNHEKFLRLQKHMILFFKKNRPFSLNDLLV